MSIAEVNGTGITVILEIRKRKSTGQRDGVIEKTIACNALAEPRLPAPL